jgi:hypothetical protein
MVFTIELVDKSLSSSQIKKICDTYKLELKRAASLKEDFEIQGIVKFVYEPDKPTRNLLPEKHPVYYDEVVTLTDELLKKMKMVNKQNE